MKECDNQSVGVLVERAGGLLLIERANPPLGFAPPAGHIDEHGGPRLAAVAEVREEVGLTIEPQDLIETIIKNRRVNNQCRRPGGEFHLWTVFRALNFSGEITPSRDETKGAGIYGPDSCQELANRTRAYQMGKISTEAWEAQPGLEPVWLDFLVELDYVT